jgi:hypothetical protein
MVDCAAVEVFGKGLAGQRGRLVEKETLSVGIGLHCFYSS